MLYRQRAILSFACLILACSSAPGGARAGTADATSDSIAADLGDGAVDTSATADSAGDAQVAVPSDTVTADAPAVPTKTAIAGTAHGKPFSVAPTAWLIGKPDTLTDTVVYLFSEKVDCDQITKAGWDGTLADGTQMLEIKMIGSDLAVYPVVATATPAPGEASVNTTLVSAGQPTEGAAKSGTVTLAAFTAGASAAGSFDLKFAGGEALSGTFAVTYCAAGREP